MDTSKYQPSRPLLDTTSADQPETEAPIDAYLIVPAKTELESRNNNDEKGNDPTHDDILFSDEQKAISRPRPSTDHTTAAIFAGTRYGKTVFRDTTGANPLAYLSPQSTTLQENERQASHSTNLNLDLQKEVQLSSVPVPSEQGEVRPSDTIKGKNNKLLLTQ